MRRRLLLAAALVAAVGLALAAGLSRSASTAAAYPTPHPTVTDYQFIKATVPTEADCEAVTRTCFTPQAIQSAYNVGPLHSQGWNGKGITIAIVDSYGSDTMAHDLHVFNQTFGLQPMCGEEGVTCTTGMPKFSELSLNGTPATKPQPGNGTHQEDKTAWALEVALDVETSHAIAPMANILLVHTNTAETLGVQGFPNMMKAEDYVVTNHLAQVISQSFASAEDAFNGGTSALENLRYAFKDAAANGVTVLGSSGDDGSTNFYKSPVSQGGSTIPFPSVEWPASDPLVTGVGGTYLCTKPTALANEPRTTYIKPGIGAKCGSSTYNAAHAAEVAWTFSGGGFSHVFSRPSYQSVLPSGSTPIPASARGVPDIAFQASSATGALVYLSLPPDGTDSNVGQTGWWDIGGTSLSCPQWAGLVAIADQINKAKYGQTGLGLINPALYKLASTAKYATDFFDIAHTAVAGVANDNQEDPSIPGYPATTGWDPVTGLGTPNAALLIPDLVDAAHS